MGIIVVSLRLQGVRQLCEHRDFTFFLLLKTNKKQFITIKQIDLFKMATFGIDAGLQTLREVVHDLHQSIQGDFFPGLLQRLFQRFNVRMGLLARFFF